MEISTITKPKDTCDVIQSALNLSLKAEFQLAVTGKKQIIPKPNKTLDLKKEETKGHKIPVFKIIYSQDS